MTHKTAGYHGGYLAWPIAVTAFPFDDYTTMYDMHVRACLADVLARTCTYVVRQLEGEAVMNAPWVRPMGVSRFVADR